MKKIKPSAINHMTSKIFVNEDHSKDNTILMVGKLGVSKSFAEDEISPRHKEVIDEIDHDTKVKIGEEFFQNLADFLNKNNQTILSIVNPKVYDKVLNAKEYQLLKYKHLFKLLTENGFTVTSHQRQSVYAILTPFLDESLELNSLLLTLTKYGNIELFPKSNQHINYQSKASVVLSSEV